MFKVISSVIISVLIIIVSASIPEFEDGYPCLTKLLFPIIEGCPTKSKGDIYSYWKADECAYRKIGLVGDDDELHMDKFLAYLKPYVIDERAQEYLDIETATYEKSNVKGMHAAFEFMRYLLTDREVLNGTLKC